MKKKHLLLVEDEEHLAFTVSFNLRSEGYTVAVATCLADARRELSEASFDIILLDVMLPDGDGMEFCQELRERGDHTPVLMLTAKGSSKDIVEGLEMGADDYLTKPFALSELFSRITAMLRRHRWNMASDSGKDTHEFAGFVVDFKRAQVHSEDGPVDITELELRLLRFFIDHEHEAISRKVLLEEVWELPGTTSTRAVDNFIVRLRRIFEKDPSNPRHILTVRGVGYRFVSDP